MNLGSFTEESIQAVWEFTRCVRPDGTAYGTAGQCRKGTEQLKEGKGLFQQGHKISTFDLDKKADVWRKRAGLEAFPFTLDWDHDRVHVLVHEFLGGSGKIGKWIGQGSKSPTPAEETLINMVHRAAYLKVKAPTDKFSDADLVKYFNRDISFMRQRGNIPDSVVPLYFSKDSSGNETVRAQKFIKKYREMERTPGFDKLLDAAYNSFTKGDIFL
jgi:hypothetical protein